MEGQSGLGHPQIFRRWRKAIFQSATICLFRPLDFLNAWAICPDIPGISRLSHFTRPTVTGIYMDSAMRSNLTSRPLSQLPPTQLHQGHLASLATHHELSFVHPHVYPEERASAKPAARFHFLEVTRNRYGCLSSHVSPRMS